MATNPPKGKPEELRPITKTEAAPVAAEVEHWLGNVVGVSLVKGATS